MRPVGGDSSILSGHSVKEILRAGPKKGAQNQPRPPRVGNGNTDAPLFQDVEHRHPILSGRLHAHIQTVVFMEPVSKPVQI